MKKSNTQPTKYVGSGNRLLTLVSNSSNSTATTILRANPRLKYFDKETFEFVDEISLVDIKDKYLKKIFELEDRDPLLQSYLVTAKQKKYMERLSGLEIDLDQYDYFMEC